MKRPLGIWILLSAGVLWLSTQDVHGIRATSLILAKTSTATTTSTAATTLPEEIDSTEAIDGATNSTKPALTGIPQIDYIYDPNLPKELNGYNLSDYPFYERVPENITFKCDGLHDGFYASVPHKCQVYHHCLFGTRFDFLCANYTAFDQKTFICHFASEVDCNNSKKFWHRNDALYQAATTTTSKPLVIATTSPPPTVLSTAVPSGPGIGQWRGGGRPYRRRRPYYEYYEDYYDDFYYDDRPRSRGRKRPKPRPRPLYEDDYVDEYEDELYERRGGGGRRNENRRPYSRRPNANRGRNKDRPRYNYDDEYDEYYEFEDNEDINSRRRKPTNKNKKSSSRKRPAENGNEDGDPKHQKSETQTVIKPISGTIYDRPRIAPKIKLPVPKNEANKYAYKPTTTTRVVHKIEDDYDSYEDNIKLNNKMEQKQKLPDNKPRGLNIKDDEKVSDDYYYYDYYDEDSTSKEKDTAQKESYLSTKKENEKHKNEDNTTSSTTTSTTTTTTTQTPLVNDESELEEPVIIRLVKRPFVPNRGGNQNAVKSSRPAGSRAITQFLESSTQLDVVTDTEYEKDFKPMITTKAPEKKHYVIENYMYKDNTDVRTHQPAKPTYKNSLDINVEDYDVTLNDALNPTLPNLPVRSYPAGFGVSNDYSYNNYQKSNKFSPEQTASTATTNYLLKTRPPRYENRQVSLEKIVREPPVQTAANFRGFYSVVDDYRPKQSQNTYSYYTRY
ncbi:uncharacterized protein LOC130451609 isoform X3 [Diorhabda sublineata]|uniref:uncharacterized protein LOC130451609 isoform X3 n=1 Tax=Diorhabda sublineata TaxID=1163346 RepID=UPI0024E0A5DD|nr:uncharacterized protein LOC130451609 isoform X3 [Diorhabda sublineata]